MRRIVVNVLVILVLVLGFTLVTAAPAAAAVITVDDDGGADYTSIQAAIDNANPGDTVSVASGVYAENLTINKTLNVIAPDGADNTFLGQGYTVSMELNFEAVVFDGFSLTGDSGNETLISFSVNNSSSVNISNCLILNYDTGIYCSDNTMDNNSSVNITGNTIANGDFGILFDVITGGSELYIENNLVGGNTHFGIAIGLVDHSTVSITDGNIVCENDLHGVYICEVFYSTVDILDNTVGAYDPEAYEGNGNYGIVFDIIDYASTVTITGNTADENLWDGIAVGYIGYDTYDADDNDETAHAYYTGYGTDYGANTVIIDDNNCRDNGNPDDPWGSGIYLCTVNFASNVYIRDNTCTGNYIAGISLEYLGCYGDGYYVNDDTDNVTLYTDNYSDYFGPQLLVSGNTLTDNGFIGLYQYDYWEFGATVAIEDNTITGNDVGGIYHDYCLQNDAHVTITGNTINTNGCNDYPGDVLGGIIWYDEEYIRYRSTYVVEYNDILNNIEFGIYIYDVDTGCSANINYNNIAGNTLFGLFYDPTASEIIDATNNWWGNASGPQVDGLSYTSYGDVLETVDWIDYQPWLLGAADITNQTATTYDLTLPLKDGWTLVSTPAEVAAGTAWVGTNNLTDTTTILAYKYTAGTGYSQVTLATQLTSVDAYYVKTDGGGGVGIIYSTSAPGVVTKNLGAGWNVISSASEYNAYDLLMQLRYVQIGEEIGAGMTNLASQGNYNQWSNSFYYTTVTDAEWTALDGVLLCPYDGFWVYMNAAKIFGVIPDNG